MARAGLAGVGTLIVADNVVRDAEVADSESTEEELSGTRAAREGSFL